MTNLACFLHVSILYRIHLKMDRRFSDMSLRILDIPCRNRDIHS